MHLVYGVKNFFVVCQLSVGLNFYGKYHYRSNSRKAYALCTMRMIPKIIITPLLSNLTFLQ